jgi:hypothetical protein
VTSDETHIAFRVATADLDYWLGEVMPVILIVYDVQADLAYWLYVQAHIQNMTDFNLALIGETVTLYLDRSNMVETETIQLFASLKREVQRQMPEVIRYVF